MQNSTGERESSARAEARRNRRGRRWDDSDVELARLAGKAEEEPGASSRAGLTWFGAEVRALTLVYCDLVGSTALSARHDPDRYRRVVVAYRSACRRVVEDEHDGLVSFMRGDGLLALFGFPRAGGDDTHRAVAAGLKVISAVNTLSRSTSIAELIGGPLATRVAVHHGLVSVEDGGQDVYGFAANLGARLLELARPNSLVVSVEVMSLVGSRFSATAHPPQRVKGVEHPLAFWSVTSEKRRARSRTSSNPTVTPELRARVDHTPRRAG
jgi:class 3 adenylate cyclase